MVEATGFAPLAARPGEQRTALFSLRPVLQFSNSSRKPLAHARASTLKSRRLSVRNQKDHRETSLRSFWSRRRMRWHDLLVPNRVATRQNAHALSIRKARCSNACRAFSRTSAAHPFGSPRNLARLAVGHKRSEAKISATIKNGNRQKPVSVFGRGDGICAFGGAPR